MESQNKFQVSRRTLLKDTAIGAAGVSTMGIADIASAASKKPAKKAHKAPTAQIRNFDMIEAFYANYPKKLAAVRTKLNRPLTLSEKILFTHLYDPEAVKEYKRGASYAEFRPDRAGTHDIGGPMAILQFMVSGKKRIALPAAMVCDHLVTANAGARKDIAFADHYNKETYDFLRTVSRRYGFDFWPAGSGICHQVFLENYDFPGGMMLVTDSHTPTACGLGMLAIGVGGADLVDALMGSEWELKMPKLIGIKLTGKLQGWASPKDVILRVAQILTTKGGTNCIIEYFGDGADTLSATGKATIGNMGAEVGSTTSVFPYDSHMKAYLKATNREAVADLADGVAKDLQADPEVYAHPEKYFDRVIELNLSELKPLINGPVSPDAAMELDQVGDTLAKKNLPENIEVALVGSCTNSSYEDFTRAASIVKQCLDKGVKIKTPLIVVPGSVRIRETLKRDGILQQFEKLNATVMTTACGPCIGQWDRHIGDKTKVNTIIESFNRNFAGRNDGSKKTQAFLASPEIVVAMAINGDMRFNPLKSTVTGANGVSFKLATPVGEELPSKGFATNVGGCIIPDFKQVPIVVAPNAERIRLLTPFPAWNGKDYVDLPLLIKAKGKCTTDHISPGGKWLPYRGNIDRISDNLLERATNAFNGKSQSVWNVVNKDYESPAKTARLYKNKGIQSIIVGDDNYGEGSSREHAAMEPRYLGVVVVLAKSLARIHESNLKKQGILALTFVDPKDYDKIREKDRISVLGLSQIAPGKTVTIVCKHEDGTEDRFQAQHSYNAKQLTWFRAGSAMNALGKA